MEGVERLEVANRTSFKGKKGTNVFWRMGVSNKVGRREYDYVGTGNECKYPN